MVSTPLFLLFCMNCSLLVSSPSYAATECRISEHWGKDGELAFLCEFCSPELEHQRLGSVSVPATTTLLMLYGFLIKDFCYYEFTEEI